MAKMIPPIIGKDVESSAEKLVFDLIAKDPGTKDWVVVHSLGLAETVEGKYGEIDFVVLVPDHGIFCLEVKGGNVKRENGRWVFINRHGQRTVKDRSPFLQSRTGMFTLIQELERKYSSNHPVTRLLFRYGVLFPHIEFVDYGTECKSWEVYDRRNSVQPISEWIKRLGRNSHDAVRNTRWFRDNEWKPTPAHVNEIANFLRGDFELIRPLVDSVNENETLLLKLTEEQYSTLDALEDNERCLFEGGAGTGKTVLAAEFARRESKKGSRVAFFTYNKFLAQYVAAALNEVEGVTVVNLHKWMRDTIIKSHLKDEFLELERNESSTVFYRDTYPLFASDAITGTFGFDQFDALIIDEAQDLLSKENLQVFDDLLRGGLNGGRWAIFGDFHRQAIYADIPRDIMLGYLRERAPFFTVCRLTKNCRNTKRIAEETASISGFDVLPFVPTSILGDPVDYLYYKDETEQAQKIEAKIKTLLSGGLKPKDITILSPKHLDRSCLSTLRSRGEISITNLSDGYFSKTETEHITFSTIQAFKGLENTAVILTDIDSLSQEDINSLFYIGMSRARTQLILVMPESLKTDYATLKLESLLDLLSQNEKQGSD